MHSQIQNTAWFLEAFFHLVLHKTRITFTLISMNLIASHMTLVCLSFNKSFVVMQACQMQWSSLATQYYWYHHYHLEIEIDININSQYCTILLFPSIFTQVLIKYYFWKRYMVFNCQRTFKYSMTITDSPYLKPTIHSKSIYENFLNFSIVIYSLSIIFSPI